ncbi:hypothetical protein HDV63DRAFT_399955 [Trichoderma sp. SZMC 28014]
MGNNLSSTFEPDLSKVVLSPTDRRADIILGMEGPAGQDTRWRRKGADGAGYVGGVAGCGGVSGDGEWMIWEFFEDDKETD